AQVAQALFGAFDDVIIRKHLLQRHGTGRPLEVFRRNFGCDVDSLTARTHNLTNQPLAVSIAISQRGINKVQSLVNGELECLSRFFIIASCPLYAADAPRSVSDFRHFNPISSQSSIFHCFSSEKVPQCRLLGGFWLWPRPKPA